MKKYIKENKFAILIGIIIYIYSIFTTHHYFTFSYSEFDLFTWARYFFIRGTFVILEFAIVFYIQNLILKLIKKDEKTKKLLIFFIVALAINVIFLLLIWPGNWINDELGVLENAKSFKYYSWQNYLTVVFFSLCVMIIPSAIAIPIIQIIFISYAFAYFINYVSEVIKTKWVWLLYLVLLLPPIIYNNMYPLRITMYTYIELIFLSWLYKKHKEKDLFDIKTVIISAVTIFVLAFWRTEGIYYLALPIILYFLFKDSKKIIVKCVVIEIIAFTLLATFTYMDKNYDYEAYIKYKTTAFINPLSILLQEDLKGNVEEEINKIDKVIDIELLKANPSHWNILIALDESKGLYRENITQNYDGVMGAYAKIILNNFPEFLKQRIEVFKITNGDYDIEHNYYTLNDKSVFTAEKMNIVKRDILGDEISNDVRDGFISILRGEKFEFIKSFYNVTPILFSMIILFIVLLFLKKIPEALLVINLIAKSVLVFLTTPATFFMYYYPLYLEGILILGACVVMLIKKGKEKWIK